MFALAALCVGGCSGGGGRGWVGQGVGTTTVERAVETTTKPEGEAPAVAEPLDVEGLRGDPCDAVGAEQLGALGITDPGVHGSDTDDPECRWHLATSQLHVVALMLEQWSRGNCQLWVGVTDELVVNITTYFLEVEPCPVAEQVATAMIEHARS